MTKVYTSGPYYDDFDPKDNYHRILFRPGRAVQARELTQLQTAIQNQVKQFSDFTFKDGSIVSGCAVNWDFALSYLKINDNDTDGDAVDVTQIEKGYTLTGLTSNVTGYVVITADGSQTDSSNTKTIFLKYTSANVTTKGFANAESVAIRTPAGSLVTTVTSFSSGATGLGSAATVGNGIVYVGGVFVEHEKQTIILDRYFNTPSYKIGLSLVESIVTSDDDNTLLDPAVGSSNYFAPGADRYKAATVLTKKDLNDSNTENFYTILEVENGLERRMYDRPQLNLLLDELAKRTFEESGNYTVKPFKIRIREHLNTGTNGGLYSAPTGNINKLAVGVEPGSAYVNGYRIQNSVTEYVSVDKGIDTNSEEQQPISFGYGNYILVNEMAGPWDIDNGTLISLRNANATVVTSQTYGSAAAPGAEIGNARIKSVVYDSGSTGTANGIYKVYLYDVNLNSNSFANVRSVYYNAGSGPDSFGDVFLTGNIAVLQESTFNTGVFKFPQKAIKTLRDTSGNLDNSYQFKKKFGVTVATNGTFSVTSAVANEEFPFSAGDLNATQKRQSLVLALTSSAQTANLTGNVTFLTNSNVVYGNATTFTTNFSAGQRFIAGGNTYRVANVVSNSVMYVTNTLMTSNVSNGDYAKVFASGEYIDLTAAGTSGATRTATVVTDTQITVNIKEALVSTVTADIICDLQKTDGQEMAKTLNEDRYVKIDCSSAGTAGTYGLGFSDIFKVSAIYHGSSYATTNTDVTDQFLIDNGQRDTVYTHGRIVKKSTSTLSLTSASRLLIKLDYFSHDSSSGVGFLSVDSYPIDDTGVAAGTIKTEEIPTFTSPSSGVFYDLRDCIDIRPRYADTATSSTTIGSASVNPTSPTTFVVPTGGLRVPAPNEEFNTDLDYYLSRFDVLYVDRTNLFAVKKGVPGLYPAVPEEPAQSMEIATVFIPPYPSLPPQSAVAAGRQDYATKSLLADNRRYTMKDVGAINQRVSRLEYYTALSFLEKNAKDLVIPSDVTGLDRFKNGFLVDNFAGHSIGDLSDLGYACSIDPKKGELRPKFYLDNLDVELNSSSSSNILRAPKDAVITFTSNTGVFLSNTSVTSGGASGTIQHVVNNKLYVVNVSGTFSNSASITSSDATATISAIKTPNAGALATLTYTHQIFAENPYATKPRNAVGDLLFAWLGEIEFDPPADNWSDTTVNPDLVVNFDNNQDNWIALADAWGTQWQDWRTDWVGDPRNVRRQNPRVVQQTTTTDRSTNDTIINQTINTTLTGTFDLNQSRTGSTLQATPEVVNYDLGNRVIDVTIVPFMRSILVSFNAIRLKPNTLVYPFFDGELVSSYCRPVSGNFGDALITDSEGALRGFYRIPNDDTLRFRVGSKEFTLIDDDQNRVNFSTTRAVETFTSSGIGQTQESTILSSRQARLGIERLRDTRVVQEQSTWVETTERTIIIPPNPPAPDFGGGGGDGGGAGGDPTAQTFIIDNTGYGIFATKIDLFFRTKSASRGVTVQIREVVNGYPGPRILPFGSAYLSAEEVNVSEDGSAPTPFTFPSPVYLQEGVEYCFVVLPSGNDPGYNLWVSELGENQVGTTNRVSAQPYVGMLFTSGNNRTWNPLQPEDIKFTLYRAKFDTNTTATVILENKDEDYLTLGSFTATINPGDTFQYAAGQGTVSYFNSLYNQALLIKNGNARVRANVTGSGNILSFTNNANLVGQGTLFTTEAYANAAIYSSNTGTRIGRIKTIISDTQAVLETNSTENTSAGLYVIFDELINTSNANAFARVETIDPKYVTLFHTNFNFISFYPNEFEWQYKIRDDDTNTVSSYKTFLVNENYGLDSQAKVDSNTIEDSARSNTKSLVYKVEFSTTDDHVSPMLDTAKMSSIIVKNRINNDSTGETTNSGNAEARYISKLVVLEADQDSEDIKVLVTAYKPSGTNIEIYVKPINANDSTPSAEAGFIKMELTTSDLIVSTSGNEIDYKEYEYVMPNSALTGPNGELQYTQGGNTYTGFKSFAIKIVMLSTDPAITPIVKDYRAIALQI